MSTAQPTGSGDYQPYQPPATAWADPNPAPTQDASWGTQDQSWGPQDQSWGPQDPSSGYPVQYQPYVAPDAQRMGLNPYVTDHPEANGVLVMGILSILVLPLLGPFTIVRARRLRREVANNPQRYRDSGTLTAGLVTGIVGTVELIVVVLLFLLGILAFLIVGMQ